LAPPRPRRAPHLGGGLETLAAAYERVGRQDDAARARRDGTRARRNAVIATQREARLAMWRREWPRARELLEQAVAADPGYGPVRDDLERVRTATGDGR